MMQKTCPLHKQHQRICIWICACVSSLILCELGLSEREWLVWHVTLQCTTLHPILNQLYSKCVFTSVFHCFFGRDAFSEQSDHHPCCYGVVVLVFAEREHPKTWTCRQWQAPLCVCLFSSQVENDFERLINLTNEIFESSTETEGARKIELGRNRDNQTILDKEREQLEADVAQTEQVLADAVQEMRENRRLTAETMERMHRARRSARGLFFFSAVTSFFSPPVGVRKGVMVSTRFLSFVISFVRWVSDKIRAGKPSPISGQDFKFLLELCWALN